eukprot:SAG31_NODE_20501_length_572_cov_6.790698_2_plen_82_part_00
MKQASAAGLWFDSGPRYATDSGSRGATARVNVPEAWGGCWGSRARGCAAVEARFEAKVRRFGRALQLDVFEYIAFLDEFTC